MRVVSSEQMRELDRRTIEEYGTPGVVLMDRAGLRIAEEIITLIEVSGLGHPVIQLIAGRGNNGGDAFVAARHLIDLDQCVEVLLAGAAADLQGDALTHFQQMNEAGVPLIELTTREEWEEARDTLPPGDLLVDGLLGTGTQGPVRGPIAGAIEYILAAAPQALVVSIDVPSGLDPDTGDVAGPAVQADVTLTLGLVKKGLLAAAAQDAVGQISVLDIGFPQAYIDQIPVQPHEPEIIDRRDLLPFFRRRSRGAHKGDFGKILLIGGSCDYSGAIILAAQAALRSGAGLVTVLVPLSIAPIVAVAAPEIMVRAAPETDEGTLASALWDDWRKGHSMYDAILVGPGMTRHAETRWLLENLLRQSVVPLVLDADAISVFAGEAQWMERANVPLVLTPHPGEFSSLFGQRVEAVQSDRPNAALRAAQTSGATIILKGAHTLVAHSDHPPQINLTGNPGMATGGSGDVLAGMVTAFVGQGFSPYDAARAAVYLHGKAGDMAAWQKSEHGLIPTDLIEELPYAFKALTVK